MMTHRWITIEAERVLYVDRGRDAILCDRGHRGRVTMVLELSDDEAHKLRLDEQQANGE